MKPFYYSLIICGFGVLALSSQARAQGATPDTTTDGQPTYGQLSSLVSQIAILKAQAQIVQLQQQIAEAKRAAAAADAQPKLVSPPVPMASGMPALPAPPYPAPTDRPAASSQPRFSAFTSTGDDKPQILSITGRDGQLSALLLMPGGGQVEAVPGTPLNNGAVVRVVSPQSVQVLQNGRLITLPFAGLTSGDNAFAPGG